MQNSKITKVCEKSATFCLFAQLRHRNTKKLCRCYIKLVTSVFQQDIPGAKEKFDATGPHFDNADNMVHWETGDGLYGVKFRVNPVCKKVKPVLKRVIRKMKKRRKKGRRKGKTTKNRSESSSESESESEGSVWDD